jgi:ribosomal protein S18 acetylase RimI-like enzyme
MDKFLPVWYAVNSKKQMRIAMLTVEVFSHATDETRAIRTRVFIEEQGFVTPQEEFDRYDEGGVHLLARWQGEPAGTGRMIFEDDAAPGRAKFGRIAVLPQYRGLGIGEALTAKLIQKSRELKLDWLMLEVRPSNIAAVTLYNKLGFAEIGKRPNFYSFPREDALLMRIDLV